MKDMLHKAFKRKQTTQNFSSKQQKNKNIKKNEKKIIGPYLNQNILSEVVTKPMDTTEQNGNL